ncbi:hypothetical protein A3P64_09215 [Lactobacillus johnsonii]|uniref:Replication protein n=1 Tax=Lactobacillus johnsonii TaxID=33959 RepID=A0AAX0PTL8_LACJH|nr:hypothetical protein [Lactobacillus johnsonii]PAB40663.1 hypothetical protein A3P60_09390 [Lactobacillus johnsonii]PAB51959.1 hypothetical protein A3P64_09215 [Lactobacillus johnsonii]
MSISTSSSLLINEAPLQVLPSLAVALKNVHEAIILQQVQYWLSRSNFVFNGRKWVYNTLDEWHEQFPWITKKSVGDKFRSLEKKGILIVGNFNKLKYDRTKWYSIDYDKLNSLINNENIDENVDMTDKEVSSSCIEKKLPHGRGKNFLMDEEETSSSKEKKLRHGRGKNFSIEEEETSSPIPETTRDYAEITQRVRSKSDSKFQNYKPKVLEQFEIEFEKLWNLYPKKIGKKDAFGSYVNWRGENSENTYEKASKHLSDYLKYIDLNNISPRYIFNGSNWFGGHIDDEVDLSKPKKFSGKKHVRELPDWDEVAREQNQKKTENGMSSEEYDRDRIFKEFSATENKDQQSDTVSSKPDAGHGNNSFEMSDDVRQVYHDLGLDEFLD